MNDKELADAIVVLVDKFHDWGERPGQASDRYGEIDWPLPKIAHDFVRDWRVAGAVMEKCFSSGWSIDIAHWHMNESSYNPDEPGWVELWHPTEKKPERTIVTESLPRAISLAGVEVLVPVLARRKQ